MPEPPAHVAVSIEGVSKAFRLPHERVHTLKERLVHPLRRRSFERLQALEDVSLAVEKGEFFGIVGRNGSGKSTLMKCLAGVYSADAGEMWLRGRMAPFIELGVGFNPELTAHDNVLLNAVMLGLTPEQARERYDAILDFAGLHAFQDLKLKNYSSGMQVRLAFAVMVHVDADLLLIDEVLAVGDAAFQQKCYDVLQDAKRAGRTILLVTHDMDQVQRFCDRAMLLERGRVVEVGEPREVARRYMAINFASHGDEGRPTLTTGAGGTGRAIIVKAWSQDADGTHTTTFEQGGVCALCLRIRFVSDAVDPVLRAIVSDPDGQPVFVAASEWHEPLGAFVPGEILDLAVSFDNWLAPGRYSVTWQVLHPGTGRRVMAEQTEALSIVVTGSRAGGGVVDIPHAFDFLRSGAAPERLG